MCACVGACGGGGGVGVFLVCDLRFYAVFLDFSVFGDFLDFFGCFCGVTCGFMVLCGGVVVPCCARVPAVCCARVPAVPLVSVAGGGCALAVLSWV